MLRYNVESKTGGASLHTSMHHLGIGKGKVNPIFSTGESKKSEARIQNEEAEQEKSFCHTYHCMAVTRDLIMKP